jgi:signal transduction histidine kinase
MKPLLDAWRRLHRSLFLKVLGVVLLAGLLLNVLMTASWRLGRMEQERQQGAHRGELLVRHYSGLVLADLGHPPDKAKALALAEKGLWKFRFIPAPGSGQAAWASSPEVPEPQELRPWMKGPDWGWRRGNFFVLAESRGGTLLLLAEPFKGVQLTWPWRLALLGGAALILFLAWLSIRWLLLPIKWLDQGMARVASGDLAYRLPTRGEDELGRLGAQFNAMSAQVQAMLDQRRQLLLDVSHELRTPLTRMKLGLESVTDEEARRSLDEDIRELEALIAELLEGARLEAGASALQAAGFDLSALCRELAAGFEGQAPGLELDLPPTFEFKGDRRLIGRLVQNLLSNAFKHGIPALGPVKLRLWQEAGALRLTVADQGPGLKPSDKDKLFTPFFRADPSRTRSTGGLGLGLHLCRRIAAAHGAELTASDNQPQGLVLSLALKGE